MDTPTHRQNRMYLISSLLLSLLLPILSLPVYKQTSILSSFSVSTFKGNAPASFDVKPEIVAYDWSLICPMIYYIGVIVSLIIFLRGLYNIYVIIKNGESTRHSGIKVIYTASGIPLCSFGKFVIAPRDRKENLTLYELTHENNHIRKRHTHDVLFIKVFRAFFWFNPILVLYEKRLIEVHEYQADKATQINLGKESYLSFLVDKVSSKLQPSLVHNFNSLIKKRLIMMSSESKSDSVRYIAVFPVLMVVLSLFSFESYNVYVDKNGNELTIQSDTIPSFPLFVAEKNNTVPRAKVDTISMYHFSLKREVKRILITPKNANAYLLPSNDPEIISMDWTDTISTIDYDTYLETVVAINYATGQIDTLVNETKR